MDKLRTFLASHKLTSGRVFSLGTGPEADWKIIFSVTAALSILVIILNSFMFIKIDKGEIFIVEQSMSEREELLDTELLKETVSYYQNRALEFERIKREGVSTSDPSL